MGTFKPVNVCLRLQFGAVCTLQSLTITCDTCANRLLVCIYKYLLTFSVTMLVYPANTSSP